MLPLVMLCHCMYNAVVPPLLRTTLHWSRSAVWELGNSWPESVYFVAECMQGYSTLGSQWLMRGHKVNPVLESPVVRGIAAETGRDAAQVVLRWALQHGQVRIAHACSSLCSFFTPMQARIAVMTTAGIAVTCMRESAARLQQPFGGLVCIQKI